MILATGLLFFLNTGMSREDFAAWGWRVPFLLSIVLIVVGYLIRRAVAESPVFQEMAARKQESKAPLGELIRSHKRPVLYSTMIFIGNNAAGYLLIAFFIAYATTGLGMPRSSVLLATTLASFGWLAFTLYGGTLSDRIGRVRTFQIGYALVFVWMIPLFLLIDTANIWFYGAGLLVLTVGLGLSYGPMSAMYAEMFPVAVRYSGISIGYALGAILGGAFAPMIAELLIQSTGWSGSIGIYIMALCVVSFAAVTVAGETRGNNLRVAEAHEQYLREHPS
jgi:MFS family permease